MFVELGESVLFEQVAEQTMVEVIAAQRAVAAGGFDFKQSFGQLQYGYVECAAPKSYTTNVPSEALSSP